MLWFITSFSPTSLPSSMWHKALKPVTKLALTAVFVGLGLGYQGIQAATSTKANLDGYKINTVASRSGAFSAAKVTVRKVTTGAINSSTAQPFFLNALPASTAGDHYTISISPNSVPGYTVKGLTWCLNACTGYNELTSNFRAGNSTDFVFYPGNNYHMRWIYQPAAIPAPVPTQGNSPTSVPATPNPVVEPTLIPSISSPIPSPDSAAKSDSSRESTYMSDDHIVDIIVRAGTITDHGDCSVSGPTETPSLANGQSNIAGPYRLVCKTPSGNTVKAFAKPVVWTYRLQERPTKGEIPKAFVLTSDGSKKEVAGSFYDEASRNLIFETTDTGQTLVIATSARVSLMVYGLIGLVVLIVGLGLGALFFIRRPAKRSYEDYIRSKYYDL